MSLERGRRIDYIMVRAESQGPLLEIADCPLVLDEPLGRIWASDHFGVLADLQVPSRPLGVWADGLAVVHVDPA